MSISELIERQQQELGEAIRALPCVSADKLGLDIRAGHKLYIDEADRAIYVENHNLRALDYYGGFEYITDCGGRLELGQFTRFDGYESERVAECFEALDDSEDEDNE
jgi:hypothetical protein